jgi:hypothetical protein
MEKHSESSWLKPTLRHSIEKSEGRSWPGENCPKQYIVELQVEDLTLVDIPSK